MRRPLGLRCRSTEQRPILETSFRSRESSGPLRTSSEERRCYRTSASKLIRVFSKRWLHIANASSSAKHAKSSDFPPSTTTFPTRPVYHRFDLRPERRRINIVQCLYEMRSGFTFRIGTDITTERQFLFGRMQSFESACGQFAFCKMMME